MLLNKAPPITLCQLMHPTSCQLRMCGCCLPCVGLHPQQGSTRSLACPSPACLCMHHRTTCPGGPGPLHSRPDAQPPHTHPHHTTGSHSCMRQTPSANTIFMHARTPAQLHACMYMRWSSAEAWLVVAMCVVTSDAWHQLNR